MFKTVADLVEYYKKNSLPFPPSNDRVLLIQSCKRPTWILKRHDIKIDTKKMLGTGNFCVVYFGVLYKRREVAVKVCHEAVNDRKSL